LISAKSFSVSADGEFTPHEISSWIQVSSEPVVILAGETAEVPFTVHVPENAGPGGHFGGLFLSAEPSRLETVGAGVGFQVGSILNLRISGDIIEEAQIREFRADKNIYSSIDVNFISRVENTGNVSIKPFGPIEITNMFGKKVATIVLNEKKNHIFPQGKRTFTVNWQDSSIAIGPHRATLSLVFGEEGRKTISSVVSFWVLPLNILVPAVGGLLVFVLLIFFFVKLYVRKKLAGLRVDSGGTAVGSQADSIDKELYDPRISAPFSRLALTTVLLLIFTLIFLVALFFFFA